MSALSYLEMVDGSKIAMSDVEFEGLLLLL